MSERNNVLSQDEYDAIHRSAVAVREHMANLIALVESGKMLTDEEMSDIRIMLGDSRADLTTIGNTITPGRTNYSPPKQS